MGAAPTSWAVDAGAAGAREVAPGVWRLRLPLPWPATPHVNAYVLDGADGRAVLVDCGGAGHESAWDALVCALGEAGREVADVGELVITHLHSDHAGFAACVRERSGCRVWIPPGPSYADDAVHRPEALATARATCARREGVPAARLERYLDMGEELEGIAWPLTADRDLAPGTEVPTALGPLVAVNTPGHAPTHTALLQADRGALFSADLVTAVFAGSFDVGYVDDPIGQWHASLDAAEALRPSVAYPGHGRPITDIDGVLALNRDGLAAALDRIEEALAGAGPSTAFAMFERVAPDELGSDVEAWRFNETLTYLRHLVATGRADCSVGDDGVARYAAPG